MNLGWVAVAVPALVFTVFGLCYGVAIGLARARGRAAIDRNGQYVYLAVITTVATGLLAAAPSLPALGVRVPPWPMIAVAAAALAIAAGWAAGVATYLFELISSAYLAKLSRNTVMEGRTGALTAHSRRSTAMLLTGLATAALEEIVFRGGLLLLRDMEVLALALTSVAFGLNHAYFGLRNILLKTVDGFVWGGLCLLTGSLIPPLIAHLTFQWYVMRRLRRRLEANDAPGLPATL